MPATLRIPSFVQHLVTDELSYNLSRPYPFGKKFKSSVFLGSILILGFLTVFNLATTGYDKQPRYTTDPNTTESQGHWYRNQFFTWGDDTLDPECQHADIPVGHEFMTTNLGLRYTVRRILYYPPGLPSEQRSSVSYHNNRLTDCATDAIGLYLRKADMSKPNKNNLWWSWMDSWADATAHCNIANEEGEGFFKLEFRVKYSPLLNDYSYVAVDNATTNASFWWGARLLNAYFTATQYVMSGQLPDSNDKTPVYTQATLVYSTGNTTSMKDPRLFNNWYYFLESDGKLFNQIDPVLDVDDLYNKPSFHLSRPMTEGLFFAKVFRSLILVDLGNSQAPNLLLDPDLLQYAFNPGDDDFNRKPGAPLSYDPKKTDWWYFTGIPPPGQPSNNETAVPMDQAFAKFKSQTGPLETKPAFIYTKYICSVPERKATSATALLTVVATLALFQTAWGFFKYVIDRKATWKDPTGNYCEGCLDRHREFIMMDDGDGGPNGPQKTKDFPGRSSSRRGLLRDENLEDGNGRID